MNHAQFWGGAAAPYEIEQSLRFNSADSATLTRTPSSSGNLRTGTISFWIKRSKLQSQPVQNTQMSLLGCNGTAAGYGYFFLRYRYQNDYLEYGQGWAGNTGGFETLAHYRDVSAWQHVCLVNDFTNATAADKVRLYMNGVRQDLTITSALTNTDSAWNSASLHYIGYQAAYFDGYMAEFHNVDGTALDPDQFGEFDDNGVWRPIRYTGSYGTNGFYLKFDPTATNGIGHDHSGNGLHWTANNFTTSGTGTDVMSDTPTTNWATLNPLSKTTDAALSEGNLKVTFSGASGEEAAVSSIVMAAKTYWEVTDQTAAISTYGNCAFGIADVTTSLTQSINSSGIICFRNYDGNFYRNGTLNPSGSGAPFGAGSTNDVYMFAYDPATTSLWAGRNGTWFNSGNPASGTGAISTVNIGDVVTYIGGYQSGDGPATANFGQRAFAYTPPTGFKALNTSNLPAPDIADGSQYFNTVLWTGTGGAGQSITGVGFQPDLVWIKDRNVGYDHVLQDAVRGTGEDRKLYSSRTGGEADAYRVYGNVSSFDTNGFTVANGSSGDQHVNQNTYPYVAWNWLAGGSGSSNTDGSITSTVSANPSAGFSIVSYAGTGSAATVGHGLGVSPALMIVKCRNKSFGWTIYHQSLGNTRHLDFTTGTGYTGDAWNSTNPTSTVFSIGTDAGSNNGSSPPNNYIAYCFAEVEGYSKFGSFVGNGIADGPFVYTGFRPAFLLVKATNGAATDDHWHLADTTRSPYNYTNQRLFANQSWQENAANWAPNSGQMFDLCSNGFKVRCSSTQGLNVNGVNHIFMALAENPFGGSGVSPATAR